LDVDREGGGHRCSATAADFVLSGGGGDLFGQLGHGKSSSDTMTKLLREPYLDLVRVACYIVIGYTRLFVSNTQKGMVYEYIRKTLIHSLTFPLNLNLLAD
jgi:hypothetical protein